MYNPIQDGIEKAVQFVQFTEAKPPHELSEFVHCFWELKTEIELPDDFCLHAVPDACVNILFNQLDPQIAGVTALHTTFTVLNLGKLFHYVGIQFFPGVWCGDRNEIANSFVGTPYLGNLPLIETSGELARVDFFTKQVVLTNLVQRLIDHKVIVSNPVTAKILSNNATVQPKHCGCGGGYFRCELKPINADFEGQFCALKARSPKQTSPRAVRRSSLRAIY
jgi:hypothetical protein